MACQCSSFLCGAHSFLLGRECACSRTKLGWSWTAWWRLGLAWHRHSYCTGGTAIGTYWQRLRLRAGGRVTPRQREESRQRGGARIPTSKSKSIHTHARTTRRRAILTLRHCTGIAIPRTPHYPMPIRSWFHPATLLRKTLFRPPGREKSNYPHHPDRHSVIRIRYLSRGCARCVPPRSTTNLPFEIPVRLRTSTRTRIVDEANPQNQ